MIISKEKKEAIIVILVTAVVLLVILYLAISILFKAQLLLTPCELCAANEPYLKQCLGEQRYYHSLVPGGLNLSGIGG